MAQAAQIEEIHLPALTPASLRGLEAHVTIYQGRIEEMLAATAQIKAVASTEDYELAIRFAGDIAGEMKNVEAHYDGLCKSAKALHTACVELRDTPKNRLENEKKRLARLANEYQAECERKRRQAEREAEEQARREREEEQRRIEEQALRDAEALRAAGQTKEAENVLNQATSEVEELKAEPIFYAMPSTPPPPLARNAGVARRTDWLIDEENIDVRQLAAAALNNWPAFGHYLTYNLGALRAAVKAQKEKFSVPGVPAREQTGIAIKATR